MNCLYNNLASIISLLDKEKCHFLFVQVKFHYKTVAYDINKLFITAIFNTTILYMLNTVFFVNNRTAFCFVIRFDIRYIERGYSNC